MVMKKILLCSVIVFFIGLSFMFVSAGGGFKIDNALLKMVVTEGEFVNKSLKVMSAVGGDFSVDKNGLDFVSVVDFFSLEAGGEMEINLMFDSTGLEPGIYFGEILISNGEVVAVPIIFEVESDEVFFDGSISAPLEYSKVYAGGSLVVENKIFNLENIGLKNIDAHYFVEDFEGNSLFSEDENIAVGSQVLNIKTVSMPEDIEPGDYLFGVILKYGDSVGTSSYFFKVSEKEVVSAGDGENYFLWVVVILLIGLVFFIIYYLRQRDKVFLELSRQYKREIVKQKCGKLKSKEIKKRLVVVKKIYKERVRVVKKLKRQKRVDKVKSKLAEWKKQGYNVDEFIVGHEKPKGDVGKRAKKFKRQGYKL